MDDTPSLDTRGVTSQEPTSSQHENVANPESTQVNDVLSYGRRPVRDRAQSTPHKIRPMNGVDMPPFPRQRTRANSSIASPSGNTKNPNPDDRRTNAGECDDRRIRVPSLTITIMTRALKDCSQTSCNGLSRPPAARL